MHGWVGKIWLVAVAFLLFEQQGAGQQKSNRHLPGDASRFHAGTDPNLDPFVSFYFLAGKENQWPLVIPGAGLLGAAGTMASATADTTVPRTAAFELALVNARALIQVGAIELARIEYDRAMRLNRKNAPEIQKEKDSLLQQQNTSAIAVEDAEPIPVPGSPQWRYDSVVELATRQFAGRRYDSAMVNYRLAGHILPEQSFPGSQVRAIEWELEQVWKRYVSARVDQLGKEVRIALAQKNYRGALPGLYELLHYNPRDKEWVKTQFANVERLLANQGVDTEAMLAGVKLLDVWDVIGQNRPDTARVQPISSRPEATDAPTGTRPGAIQMTKPVAASSLQTEAIPYPADQLAKLYPEIDFSQKPPDQAFNMIDDEGEHTEAIRKAQGINTTLQLRDSTGNIKVCIEGIYFSKLNTYLKIRITNNSVSDFPVGPMLLSWKQRGLRLVDRVPVAVSAYPIVQPGKFFNLYYACRNMYLRDDEELYFSLQGRLGFPKYRVLIPGRVYNQEKNKRVNYL